MRAACQPAVVPVQWEDVPRSGSQTDTDFELVDDDADDEKSPGAEDEPEDPDMALRRQQRKRPALYKPPEPTQVTRHCCQRCAKGLNFGTEHTEALRRGGASARFGVCISKLPCTIDETTITTRERHCCRNGSKLATGSSGGCSSQEHICSLGESGLRMFSHAPSGCNSCWEKLLLFIGLYR